MRKTELDEGFAQRLMTSLLVDLDELATNMERVRVQVAAIVAVSRQDKSRKSRSTS